MQLLLLVQVVFQLFISFSIILILFLRDSVYVLGSSSKIEGIMIFSAGSVFSIALSILFIIIFLSRLRSITIFLISSVFSTIVLIILFATPLYTIFLASIYFSLVLSFAIWQGVFVFGLGNFLLLKVKNVYLTISAFAFWHFGVLALSISRSISRSESITYESFVQNIGLILDPVYLFLIFGFFVLSIILILIDSKIYISRWKRNYYEGSKLGWKNIALFIFVFFVALGLTIIIAPAFWRLNWEYKESEKSNQQNQRELDERRQLPDKSDRPNESPQNDENFDTGGRIENKNPQPQNVPLFFVKLGESDIENAQDLDTDLIDPTSVNVQNKYFWRASVFDGYSNTYGFYTRTYFNDNEFAFKKQLGYYFSGKEKKYQNSKLLEQKYLFLNKNTQQIIAVNRPFEVNYLANQNIPYIFSYESEVLFTDNKVPLSKDSFYYVASEIPAVDNSEIYYSASQIDYETEDGYYPFYSFNLDYEVTDFAYSIVKNETSDYKIALLIEEYLKKNYKYEATDESETSKILDQRAIEKFLFNVKQGDIQFFSGAMVRLLYELGIESRIASGFNQGEYDEELGGYIVMDNDFYYWVEVYFQDYGWVAFDPVGEATEKQKQNTPEEKELDEEEKKEIEEKIQEEEEKLNDNLEKRDEWRELNPYSEFDEKGNDPWNEYKDNQSKPTPTPQQNPDFNNDALKAIFQLIFELIKYTWWICCCIIIILMITLPPVLKNLKYSHRKGVFTKRTDYDQVIQNFEYMQDVLKDFNQEIKFPETALKFSDRFVKEFPIEIKDENTRENLIRIANIYNRVLFGKKVNPNDCVDISSSIDNVLRVYLRSKSYKSILRWYNPRGLF